MARMLSIFIMIDPDEILSSPIKDLQTYKDEAYNKTNHILTKMLEEKKLGTIFTKLELNDKEKIKYNNFVDEFKEVIEDMIRGEYEDLVPEHILIKLIEDCKSGVDYY